MSTPRILISAFEPFAGETLNSSMALLEALVAMDFKGVELHTLLLPVVRECADEQLLAAIDALTPSHVLMFGESGGCAQITPERVAINIDDYAIADNAGHQPRGEPVIVDGPVGYFSTLPIEAMVDSMNRAGLPAQVSNCAGTYLCNRIFYRVMHHIARYQPQIRAGFVHLPWLHEQTHDKPAETPGVSLQVLVSAAARMIEAIVR